MPNLSSIRLPLSNHYGSLDYGTPDGLFFFYDDGDVVETHKCRELFGQEWTYDYKNERSIGFYCSVLHLNRFAAFWNAIETKLALSTRSTIHGVKRPSGKSKDDQRYNVDHLVVIKLAPFWLKGVFRREMVSLLMRLGAVHYSPYGPKANQTFDSRLKAAIARYPLAAKVSHVIHHFLSGNTKPTFDEQIMDDENGLINYYHDVPKADLSKTLIPQSVNKPRKRYQRPVDRGDAYGNDGAW